MAADLIAYVVVLSIVGLCVWILISIGAAQRRVLAQLRLIKPAGFEPSGSYVTASEGIEIDLARRQIAVATTERGELLEPADITDIRVQNQKEGGVVVDIDLRSSVLPTLRWATAFSSEPLKLASVLKSLSRSSSPQDSSRGQASGNRSAARVSSEQQGAHQIPGNTVFLEQDLAALRNQLSKLTIAVAAVEQRLIKRRQEESNSVELTTHLPDDEPPGPPS